MQSKLLFVFLSTLVFVSCVDIPSSDVLPPFTDNSNSEVELPVKPATDAKLSKFVAPKASTSDVARTQQRTSGADGAAEILRYDQTNNGEGTYQYSYETSNGIQADEQGVLKVLGGDPPQTAEQVQGAFSYTAPDGQHFAVQYVANENGFQPTGDHLPTPPPTPEGILRALQYIQSRSA